MNIKKYSKEERKGIMKNLQKKLNTDTVAFLGYNRYSTYERYQVQLENGSTTWMSKYKLFDEEGNQIPLARDYNGIFSFAKGVATVCIRQNTKIIETETGTKFTQDRKDGMIDINGNELLPCDFDSVSCKLDGFVEIIKNGIKKATNVNEIISGKFNWDTANKWD